MAHRTVASLYLLGWLNLKLELAGFESFRCDVNPSANRLILFLGVLQPLKP